MARAQAGQGRSGSGSRQKGAVGGARKRSRGGPRQGGGPARTQADQGQGGQVKSARRPRRPKQSWPRRSRNCRPPSITQLNMSSGPIDRCMPMAITTALDVARRARWILAMGRTIDSPAQRVERAHRWANKYMSMAIATALDVARCARGSWPQGARSTAQLNVLSGRIDGVIDACLWRSQRRTMWRVVLAGSWPLGRTIDSPFNVSRGRINGVIDACYGDHNGARCGASCSQDRGRGAHDQHPNSTCGVGASMGSYKHSHGDHKGARCGASCSQDRGRGAHDRQPNSTC